jgi:hypothetical protein
MSENSYIIEADERVLKDIVEIIKEGGQQSGLDVSEPYSTAGESQLNDPFSGAVIIVTHAINLITPYLAWLTGTNAFLSILDRLKKKQKPTEQPILIIVKNYNMVSKVAVINVSESETDQVREQLEKVQ